MVEINKINLALGVIMVAGLALGWVGGNSIDRLFQDTDYNTRAILRQEQQIKTILSTQSEIKETMSIMITELRKVSDGQIRLGENFKQFEVIGK